MIINRRKIVLNTFFLYGKALMTMIISFISTRLVLHALGASDYGVYGTVGGAIVMLESMNGAMTQATQRFLNYAEGRGEKEHLVSIFNNTVLLHIGLGLLIVILLFVVYFPLFNGVLTIPADRMEAAKYIYLFLVVSTFFTIITVPYDALITAHENFLYYSIVGICVALLKLIAAFVVVAYLGDRLILYGLLMALIAVINMLVMRIFCRMKYDECCFAPRKYGDGKMIKEIGVFAGWSFVGATANMAGNHGSTILMNHFFGPILIAAKNIGDQICTQVAVLTQNMTKALNPVVVKSEGGGDRQTMLRLSFISCRFGFLLYLVIAIPFILNAEPLLAVWLKEVPDWAVLFCQLQVLRTLFEQIFTPLSMTLMAQGSVKQVNLADLIFGVLTFGILWLLYKNGFSPEWHYFISIVFLVFLSGAMKVYLCKVKCEMKVLQYIRTVVIPCSSVLILSFIFALLLQKVGGSIHVLFLVVLQIISLIIIEFYVGLNRSERRIVLSKIPFLEKL